MYEFWGSRITDLLNTQLEDLDSETLINLASNEYFKAVKGKEVKGKIITPVFKEKKDDAYKIIGIYAKKARGMMSAFILKNKLDKVEQIKDFNEAGYVYNPELSSDMDWIFTRNQKAK